MTARDPLRVMFATIAVELGLVVASFLVPPSETSFQVQRWASLALGAVLAGTIAWVHRARRGAPSEPWWIAALVVALIDLGFDLLGQVSVTMGGLWLGALVPVVIGVAGWALLWMALASDAGPERGARLTPLFLGLIAVKLVATLARLWISMNRIGSASDIGSTMVAIGWVSLLSSIAVRGLLLLLVYRLMMAEEGAIAPLQRAAVPGEPGAAAAAGSSRGRDLAFGAAWLTAGLVVTAISFSSASHGSTGGRYVVMTGAIGVGLVRIIRGLTRK